jgi:hypothetical protein
VGCSSSGCCDMSMLIVISQSSDAMCLGRWPTFRRNHHKGRVSRVFVVTTAGMSGHRDVSVSAMTVQYSTVQYSTVGHRLWNWHLTETVQLNFLRGLSAIKHVRF